MKKETKIILLVCISVLVISFVMGLLVRNISHNNTIKSCYENGGEWVKKEDNNVCNSLSADECRINPSCSSKWKVAGKNLPSARFVGCEPKDVCMYSNEKTNISDKTKDELKFCENDSDCVIVGNSCCASSSCDYISINKNYSESWESQFNCSEVTCGSSACTGFFSSECVNNQCTLIEGVIPEEIIKEVFYNSRCYKDDLGNIGNSSVEFDIKKIKNVTIKKIDELSKPEFNLTYIDILYGELGEVSDALYIPNNYEAIEKQNVTIWRVQGGVFGRASEENAALGGGTFNGCLEIMEEKSGVIEILAQGFYGYT